MFQSLRSRLWLSYFILVGSLLCIAAAGLALYLIRNPAALRQTTSHLEVVANVLQRAEIRIDSQNQNRVQGELQAADDYLNARLIVVDPSGKVFADSRLSEAPIPSAALNKIKKLEITTPYSQFRDGNRKIWIFTVRSLQNGMILVALNRKPGLTVAQFLGEDSLRTFFRVGLIALLLSFLLAWLTSQWITKPLEKITQAARLASSGQYHHIPLEGPQEVQTLAESFNDMTDSVQASEKSQRDFIANVSHDLKTPLTAIQGFAQAILDGTAETSDAIHHAAEVIHSEVTRMNHLILDLLELARIDSGVVKMTRAPIDLRKLLEQLVTRFTLQAQQAGKILTCEISTLPEFIGDHERLTQAIANVLDNALKFSPAGGKVDLQANLEGNHIEISIADEGSGISPDDLPHIFERFFQADRSRSHPSRGAGLGLSISREIIQAHGGTIIAYNNYPQSQASNHTSAPHGCTFLIKLPTLYSGKVSTADKH